MIHPNTALRWIDDRIGFGVFATEALPMGTLLVIPDLFDQRISLASYLALDPLLQSRAGHFMYRDTEQTVLLSWDHARYLNHSCNANSLLTPFGFELVVRDIAPDEEICTDYGALNLLEPLTLDCNCRQCRITLYPDDRVTMAPIWDEQINRALKRSAMLDQPLAHLLSEEQRQRIGLPHAAG